MENIPRHAGKSDSSSVKRIYSYKAKGYRRYNLNDTASSARQTRECKHGQIVSLDTRQSTLEDRCASNETRWNANFQTVLAESEQDSRRECVTCSLGEGKSGASSRFCDVFPTRVSSSLSPSRGENARGAKLRHFRLGKGKPKKEKMNRKGNSDKTVGGDANRSARENEMKKVGRGLWWREGDNREEGTQREERRERSDTIRKRYCGYYAGGDMESN